MRTVLWILLIIPIACAVLQAKTRKYPFSALVTISCLALCSLTKAPNVSLIVTALAFSVAGDYFMAHESKHNFLFGIIGFFFAHVCFLWYTSYGFSSSTAIYIIAVLLAGGYAVYLCASVYPKSVMPIRIALSAYMLISVAVFSLSLGSVRPAAEKWLFSAGIFAILFSDTLIGLSRFSGIKSAEKWICPIYYACHIFVTASMIASM